MPLTAESQASQPAELGQVVGDIIASVAGNAGRLKTSESIPTHPPQHISGSEWNPAPTSVSDSENRSHKPSHSGLILAGEQAYQTPTAQTPGSENSRYPLTSGGVQRSGTFNGLLEDEPPASSDNESGAIKPISTQSSTEMTPLSAETSNLVTASVSRAGTMSSGSERMMSRSTLVIVVVLSCLVQQML